MQVNSLKKQLILVGGGHANVQVILSFAMRPLRDVSVVLISDQILAGYSGMLPGWIAGHFTREQTHIDLSKLCSVCGVTFIHTAVTNIDTVAQSVICKKRPAFYYDLLCINTGSKPAVLTSTAEEAVIPIKPVEEFLVRLDACLKSKEDKVIVSIIGAGVAGVEVMFALCERYSHQSNIHYQLVTSDTGIVPRLNNSARKFLRDELKSLNVSTKTQFRLKNIEQGKMIAQNGDEIPSDITILCSGGKPPAWLEKVNLDKDKDGFIQVNDSLQSVSSTNVFAAGDIASIQGNELEKSGVYAVRQGELLTRNLRKALQGSSLKSYRPQKSFLKLISLGHEKALAVRGPFATAGKWVWKWKWRIDTRFVDRFNDFTMQQKLTGDFAQDPDDQMRCSGCAAKIGQSVLNESLSEIENTFIKDDSALVRSDASGRLFQSVDFFRSLIDDHYLNTLITLNHAFNDSYAMGLIPETIMSMIALPPASDQIQKNRLAQIHAGIRDGLAESGSRLIGGHTAESSEAIQGFSVNAMSADKILWSNQGMKAGDALLLSKPLGTGVLFAAYAEGKVSGEVISHAIASMLQTHYQAVKELRDEPVNACTDVTGFGLLGHLTQMMPETGVKIALHLNALPILDGAEDLLNSGFRSSLHQDNRSAISILNNADTIEASPVSEILFDPQTAGGLLLSIPADSADRAYEKLVTAGYQAVIIGSVYEATDKSTVFLEGFAR